MKKTGYFLFIGFLLMSLFYSCSFLSTEYKDHIELNNIDSIQLVIKEMDTLMHKLPLPSGYKLKHFKIGEDGSLEINGSIINNVDKLSLNDFYKHNIFSALSIIEVEKFYHNIIFLYKNEITDALQGECFWQFAYLYKSNFMDESQTHRRLIYVYNQADTSSAFFKYAYQILDSKKDVVLYKSTIPSRWYDNPPPYPEIINPYKK